MWYSLRLTWTKSGGSHIPEFTRNGPAIFTMPNSVNFPGPNSSTRSEEQGACVALELWMSGYPNSNPGFATN